MKRLVLSILTALCFSGLYSSALTKPSKPLIPIQITTDLKKDVKEGTLKDRPSLGKTGDWNSSGAPEMPYHPEYEFSYRCQVQMTDQVIRTEGGNKYVFWATAVFELSDKQASISTAEMKWYGKKLFGLNTVNDTDDKIPFALDGGDVFLIFRRSQTPEKDLVYLFLNLEQKIGSAAKVSENARVQSDRNTLWISGQVETKVSSQNSAPYPTMKMNVTCEKEK